MSPKVPGLDSHDLARIYLSGVSTGDLAKRFGVCEEAVRKRLLSVGTKIRTKAEASKLMVAKRFPIDDAEMVRLYLGGALAIDLARRYGTSYTRIHRRLRSLGIPLRSMSESHHISAVRTSQKERARRAAAAHYAVRGKRQSFQHRAKIAMTKEIRQNHASRIEVRLASMLAEKGLRAILQKAIGPYNVDVAVARPPIAVEIFGGHWHAGGRHAARFRKRSDYILDHGWTLVFIWVGRDYPLEFAAVEYIVSLAKKMRRSKAERGQEHMIYGNGQAASLGKRKLNGLPVIKGPMPRDNSTGRYTSRTRE